MIKKFVQYGNKSNNLEEINYLRIKGIYEISLNVKKLKTIKISKGKIIHNYAFILNNEKKNGF